MSLSKKISLYRDANKLRKQIAKKGMLKYHKHMNSKIVASYIVNKTLNLNNKEKFFWENK